VFLDEIRPRALRTMEQFAEAEIVKLPQGPCEGMPFRCDYMPWSRLVLAAFESGRWRRMFGRGATQSGKTLIFTVIPTLYHLFEMAESVIFGAPTQDMAYDIFCERVLPVIQETRYGKLLPDFGGGSRGGKTKVVRFQNGAILRFMGASGRDAQRSSYSARVAVLTEIDHMERPQDAQMEAGPADQIEARTSAYDASARVYGECTTTTEDGRIYIETSKIGTDTRIHLRCPLCGKWSEPARAQLTGWFEAENEVAAENGARYVCIHCQASWKEADRESAMRSPLLVHRGQSVDDAGNVVGPVPETFTFGLVWSAMHSPLRSMGTIAAEEWRAEQALDESRRKKVLQFTWSLPWKEGPNQMEISYAFLAQHVSDYHFDPLCATTEGRAASPLPEGIVFRVGTVDVQKRQLYIAVDAFDMELMRWTLFWHVIDVVPEDSKTDPDETRVRQALDEALHLLGDIYGCDSIWVDCGYKHEGAQRDVVKLWCWEQGAGVLPLLGRSQGAMEKMTGQRSELEAEVPEFIQCRTQDNGQDLWFFDVDQIKDEVHSRLFREQGSVGCHYFPADAANPERTDRSKGPGSAGWIFSHYMRVKRVITEDRRTGRLVRVWEERGRHDLWDLACYALGGAFVRRAYLLAPAPQPEPYSARTQPDSLQVPKIRTSY
jgi:phage terminase large subunit GpA-like protein